MEKEYGVLLTTDNKVSIIVLDPVYETLKSSVGGYIEHTNPFMLREPNCMIVDEEGLLKEKPLNFLATWFYNGKTTTPIDFSPIAGDVVFCKDGYRDEEPDILGYTEEEANAVYGVMKEMLDVAGL